MSKHLVLVGGGHAHLTIMLNLADYAKRGHRVTLISPSPYHYYSGMGPGLLAGIYQPREVRFHVKKMVEARGAEFVESKVERIDAQYRILYLADGGSIGYDVASFNTGSRVPMEEIASSGDTVIPVKPISNLYNASLAIIRLAAAKHLDIVVVGGGPAGVEISANVWRLVRNADARANIFLAGGGQILSGFPEKARRLVMESLAARSIDVVEGVRVESLMDQQAVLSDGRRLQYDFAFIAAGIAPSEIFQASGLPTGPDGGLLVNDYLQSVAHPELFGGGDCIALRGHSLAKVGVHVVRQNPLLKHNLLVALEGGRMKTFRPNDNYMLILNLGLVPVKPGSSFRLAPE